MTDEEMAEMYVVTLLDKNNSEFNKFLDKNLCDLELNKKQAGALLRIIKGVGFCSFLAGLKAGRPGWHKVADGDLPKESEILKNTPDNHRYEWFIVATVGKTHRALYSFAKKKWFIDYEEMVIGTCYFEPIAWCEFPKYTEE